MSEPHAEPPGADVRSFLPRPGEAVDDYAARLRALHHDLSLVLDAVERGLAAAEAAPPEIADRRGPRPVSEVAAPGLEESYEVVEEPRRSPPPPGPLTVPRGGARVEVISTPATAHGADTEGGRAWSGPQEPEGSAPWGGRRAPVGEGVPARGEPAPSPQRSPYSEPWVERQALPPRQEPWVDERGAWPPPPPPPAEMSFAPPSHAPFAQPPRRRAPAVPPVIIAALILGWLTVIALALALALGS